MCVNVVLSAPYMANGKEGNEKDVELVEDHNDISWKEFGERESGAPSIHPSRHSVVDNRDFFPTTTMLEEVIRNRTTIKRTKSQSKEIINNNSGGGDSRRKTSCAG